MASGAEANQGGGGLFNAGGELFVNNSTFTNNEADGASGSGGGILNDLGVLTVINSTFTANTSSRAGGGIEDNSVEGNTLKLTTVTFDSNTTEGAPGNGGGLHITGPGNSTVDSCLVLNNLASAEGGGLWNGSGLMAVSNTTLQANLVTGIESNQGGGGLFNAGGTVNIQTSAIVNNESTASHGGGIMSENGQVDIYTTTISNNSAEVDGGGISLINSPATVRACTIAENTSANGGGIASDGEVMLSSSIVASNTAATDTEFSGSITSQGYNLILDYDVSTFTSVDTDILNEDPILAPLSVEGDFSFAHRIGFGSPAYNAGSPDDQSPDQLNQEVFGERRDIGAYESQDALSSTDDYSQRVLNLEVYPNPTAELITIQLPSQPGTLLITNGLAQTVIQVNLQGNDSYTYQLIDNGMYFVRYITEGDVYGQTIIKE